MADIVLRPGDALHVHNEEGKFVFGAVYDEALKLLRKGMGEEIPKNDEETIVEPAAHEDMVSGQVTYKLPEWLAREKGIIGEKVSGAVEQETDKAVLLKTGKGEKVWLPKSQIEEVIIPEDQVRF
jgi:nitrogen fixation protein